MLQNSYTLPDLIDLALTVPEIGAVNFNILHAVLQALVKELKMTDVRPWCFIENPQLAQAAFMKSKLKDPEFKRFEGSLHQDVPPPAKPKRSSSADNVAEDSQMNDFPKSSQQSKSKEETRKSFAESNTQDSQQLPPTPTTGTITQSELEELPLPTPSKKDSAVQVNTKSFPMEDQPTLDNQAAPETQIDAPVDVTELVTHTVKDVEHSLETDESAKKTEHTSTTTSEYHVQETATVIETEAPIQEGSKPKSNRRDQRAMNSWQYTNLKMKVNATEEGLQRLSNIVDILLDKLLKSEQRGKDGAPSTAELEAIDERLTELEEMMARFAKDHDLLMELQRKVNELLAEFEAIKALAALLKQMQIDISMKADKEETRAALEMKADLELVLTKVDRTEFETAIEELGEAIGLLGLKFMRKNDEWEERAAEIWHAIHGKMSRDVFDAAMVKVESRLTALMYGLRKMKKVVEDLLYPESSGVTRCILCRRPACISGLECLTNWESPKRSFSDRSTEVDDQEQLKNYVDEAVAKRQKLDGPHCGNENTIVSAPRTSSSHSRPASGKRNLGSPQLKLAPIYSDRKASRRQSQIPKLPDINGDGSDSQITSSSRTSSAMSSTKSSRKSRGRPDDLFFTNKLHDELVKKDAGRTRNNHKLENTAALEAQPAEAKSTSSRSSVDIMPDPTKAVKDFTPTRLMPDTLRRDILQSPHSRDNRSSITLSPLMFDTASKTSSTSTVGAHCTEECPRVFGLRRKYGTYITSSNDCKCSVKSIIGKRNDFIQDVKEDLSREYLTANDDEYLK